MRKQEHIRCGCKFCRLGAATPSGKFIHRRVNRMIRHKTRIALAKLVEDFEAIVVSTPRTD